MDEEIKFKAKVELESAWMIPGPNLTMAQAIEQLEKQGHTILEIDHLDRRIRVK